MSEIEPVEYKFFLPVPSYLFNKYWSEKVMPELDFDSEIRTFPISPNELFVGVNVMKIVFDKSKDSENFRDRARKILKRDGLSIAIEEVKNSHAFFGNGLVLEGRLDQNAKDCITNLVNYPPNINGERVRESILIGRNYLNDINTPLEISMLHSSQFGTKFKPYTVEEFIAETLK